MVPVEGVQGFEQTVSLINLHKETTQKTITFQLLHFKHPELVFLLRIMFLQLKHITKIGFNALSFLRN